MSRQIFTWSGYDDGLPVHRALQGFLMRDVQYSSRRADELSNGMRDYRAGRRERFEGSGNGYAFECRPGGLWLDCRYEGDPLTSVLVDYDTALRALGAWSQFCDKPDAVGR